MKSYTLIVKKEDFPYIVAAIALRAEVLQDSLRLQMHELEEKERRQAEEAMRAKLPDPFDDDMKIPAKKVELNLSKPIIVPKQLTEVTPAQEKHAKAMEPVSRKAKRAALMRILKAKGSADLSTAEIARRAGVSYVTAHKARAAFAPKKGRK